ncbi:hypothetical protein PV325_011406 [Microctonus aethiopoides]|uniref:ATP synthase subunit d, mitochondrial n=1 Tax=Microctonus aethiopoides TaxID=144406 RepID=A0AA39FHT5_9HYME|nr:hypothetical protein PV325_011406 [Microctonus aethiopoides]KAK0094726.1 hypothetical protein PV326_010172 [Microctonus aethiopoides]KAK0169844.1 hypothetical protein PV328_010481 [Microctonus aethiopoides]
MAARRAIKSINWSGIAERMMEEDRAIFSAFRTKSDGYLRRMQENPETAPAIDWSYYKKHVSAAGMVDQFQKEYESLKIPYPADTYTSLIEDQEKDAQAHVQKFIQESNERIKAAEAEITRIQSLLPFNEMTLEDFAEAYPEHAWNPEKPTMWPHIPEAQPGPEPEPIPKSDH